MVLGFAVGVVVLGIAIGILTVVASNDSRGAKSTPFCTAAREYDDRIATGLSLERKLVLVGRMDEHAPAALKPDTTVFLDALRSEDAGDATAVDTRAFRRAVERVNRHAALECGFYEPDPGQGA